MKKENPKKEIKLIISDIDNTVADFFDVWGHGVAKAVTMLAKSRGISEEEIYKDIKTNTPGSDRFHPNIAYLVKNTPIVQPKNEEERVRFEKDDAKIIHEVNKMRVAGDKAYKGVLATIKKAKASGTKVVFYTDALMSVAIGRLANMNFPVDLIDGLYSRKDDGYREAPMFVKGKIAKYEEVLRKNIGDNMVENEAWKPNPEIMKKIMKSVGVEDPKSVVMVGDNVKSDGGSGIGAGTDYAWAKYGATVSNVTNHVYKNINDKAGYELGVEGHLKQMNDGNRPTVILEKSFSELTKHYKFVSANEKGKTNKRCCSKQVADKLREGR